VPLLVALVVLAASWGAGTVATLGGRLPIEDGLRRRVTIFGVGFAVLELIALLLGVAHAFRPAALDAVAGAFGVVGLAAAAREAPLLPRGWRDLGRLRWLVGAAAAIVALDAILAMAPPTSGDALGYHLTAPKLWLGAHRMFPIWWDWPTFQPFATEMHYAYAQALWSGASAVVVGAGFAGFSAVCVYGLTRELAGRAAGAVAALLWVAQGMFLWEATGGFVELVLSAFVVLSFWHLVVYLREPRVLDAALAGLALGIAASAKVHALVFAPALLLGLLVRPARRTAVAAATATAFAVAFPWYLRTWIWTGNPVYPLAFGGKYWDSYDRAEYVTEWRGYGIHGIWHLPFFPLEFVLQTAHYERGYAFGPALFVLPVVALFFRRRWVTWIAAGEVLFLVLWWQGMHQITRYLLPALALSAAMSGYAAVELWRRRGWARRLDCALAAATVAPLAVITALFAAQVLPGSFRTESTPAFVQRLTGSYDALHWLDTKLPAGGRVAVFGMRNLYWLQRPYVRGTPPLFDDSEPTPVLIRRMHAWDVRWIAWLAGQPPPSLAAQTKLIATLPVEVVTSRTLGRTQKTPEEFYVYAWCAGKGDPCSTVGS
jgi:4-amino-4-deoxy-L-arabinose transferase-like glycosyltransferase